MNKEEILYQIVAIDSELKKGFPDKIATILRNGNTGKTYTDYDFKNRRYLYCYVSDNFNIYDRLEEKDKEIKRLNNIINKALHLLTHNDIMDYRVFEEHLLNILTGDDKA